jgi:cell division protein FtsB
METDQKNSGQKKMLTAVIAALLLIVCVSLYFVYSGHKDNGDLTAQKATLDSTFRSLSDTLDVRKAEIDQITAKNVKLDSSIAASQVVIDNEKKQISGLLSKVKMTKAELGEAKGMITAYESSISDLQKRVAELSAQNQQLTSENQQLSTDLTSEKKTSSDLNAQNIVLSKKVEIGSLLKLAKVDVAGVKERQNGKETTVRNAKAAASLRISFATGENKVLSPGPLSLYVRVINPKGETIAVDNQGSGILQLAETNTQIKYSTKADVDWQQVNKNVAVYWKKNISTAGIYKVEIYQSGYLIGKGEVKLD